jgi:hypothetical protein
MSIFNLLGFMSSIISCTYDVLNSWIIAVRFTGEVLIKRMIRRMFENIWRLLILVLCQSLVLQPAYGQQTGLRIEILEGEGARNATQQIPPKPLTVRVVDANNRPVTGAVATFIAPENGPSGEFVNDSRNLTVTTGQDGVASVGAYHPNAIEGPYQIRIRVEFQGQTAMAFVSQSNVAKKKGHGKLIAILAISGAAAAAVIASRSGGSTSASSAPTITFGGSAVGAPQQ